MPATKRVSLTTDDDRWQAIVDRVPAADGLFFYSVKTTGVYCRPVCPARLARRENVRFHATCDDAEKAGFRACKRCQPRGSSLNNRRSAAVLQACRLIEAASEPLSLLELSEAVGMSSHHFHRVFKSQTGVTPKVYAMAHRNEKIKRELVLSDRVTDAVYSAGFQSSGRFYESSSTTLGMTPTAFRAGGAGISIRFAVGECWLGTILVAASDVGVCCILLGDEAEVLVKDLQDRFPAAELIGADKSFETWVAKVVGFVANPSQRLDLPLDIQGTAFQQRVWQALQQIPAGSTATYTEIAEQIGCPKSVRSVGTACGANPLAVAIPCHRVVRTDGSLSGYRWGIDRKARLLNHERESRR